MRISFGTLSLCAWLGDVEAVRLLDHLNFRRRAASARIYYIRGIYHTS